ncbi:MAG: ABC transporter ATP-binding protein [Deltaproteobacteria bacterium]|nr:ABC transporter ATP-binding protein [Deltaproteobacteria bacterium]
MPLVEIHRLSKFFGGLAAVTELNLDVMQGEILGLIGPNGAGKTTVLNMVGGTIFPSRGKIIFNGEDITNFPPYRRAQRGIARVFQENLLFGNFTALENIRLGFHLHSRMGFAEKLFNRQSTRNKEKVWLGKAFQMLEYVGLVEHTATAAINLPHGKQRLLGLAIALATQPQLLLLDEPVSGMNAEEVEGMVALIKMLREKRGITCVVVEHNMRAVMGLCDRIAVLNFGEKIAEGLPRTIVESKAVVEAYLGTE